MRFYSKCTNTKKGILPFFVPAVVNSFPDFHLKLMCGLLNVYVNGVRPEVISKMKHLCVPYRLGGQKRAKDIISQHRLTQSCTSQECLWEMKSAGANYYPLA